MVGPDDVAGERLPPAGFARVMRSTPSEDLSDVLSEFARTMLKDFPIQGILDHLVCRIVDIMPVTGAGVTLISPGREPHYVAASDKAALRFEKLQTELDEGPCLAAYHSGEAISVPDLSREARFPRFSQRALSAGLVAVFTFFLPALEVPRSAEHLSWRERLGLDALTLLKNRNHRVVFITTTLFNIPLCAFYPYAPAHLRDLGFAHTSAWMSLAQTTEIIGMFSLGWLLLNWRVKWIFACGLGFGIVRFALSALNSKFALLAGITLHGASFTLVFVTAAIYLDQRIDPAWRTRAQALLALMNGGVGSLIGYLGTGWWFNACTHTTNTDWPVFWGGLAALVGGVLVYFLSVYRTVGDGKMIKRSG